MQSEHYSRIFLLSHMRAYTSLVAHILGSHPAINGYFEMHISYDDVSALDKQFREFRKDEALKENSRYLFDKLLHNDYRLRPERLGLDDTKILVTLREPEQSIKSIVSLFSRRETDARYGQPEEAIRYYVERLGWLAEFCRSAARNYYYFDAESARSKPEELLAALGRWLDLESPLSEKYKTFGQTGKARKGDSSELIHRGEIVLSTNDYSHVHLPRHQLQRARWTYRDCRRRIIDNASGFVTG